MAYPGHPYVSGRPLQTVLASFQIHHSAVTQIIRRFSILDTNKKGKAISV